MERTKYPKKEKAAFGLPDIGIPSEVLFHPDLTCTEKILFGFLRNLAQGKDGCWASNKYLGNLLCVGTQTISNAINNLKKHEFIKIYNEQKGQKTIRRIFINPEYPIIYHNLMEEVQTQLKNGNVNLKNNSDINNAIAFDDHYKKIYTPPIKKFIPPYKKIYTKYNNNNKINKINKDNIPQNKKATMTWKQLTKQYGRGPVKFVKHFLEVQKENFPKLIKENITPNCTRVLTSLDCLDKLQRLDGFDFETEIKPALEVALRDEFWARNVLSLGSLRNKGRNGEKKFVNIQTTLSNRIKTTSMNQTETIDKIIASQRWNQDKVEMLKKNVFTPLLSKLNGSSSKLEITKSICILIDDIEKRQKRPQKPNTEEDYRKKKFIYDKWELIPKSAKLVTEFVKWLDEQTWIGGLKPGHFDIDGKTFATFLNEYQNKLGFDVFEGRMLT